MLYNMRLLIFLKKDGHWIVLKCSSYAAEKKNYFTKVNPKLVWMISKMLSKIDK